MKAKATTVARGLRQNKKSPQNIKKLDPLKESME